MNKTIHDIRSTIDTMTTDALSNVVVGNNSYTVGITDATLQDLRNYYGPNEVYHLLKHLLNKVEDLQFELTTLRKDTEDEIYTLRGAVNRLQDRY